MITIQKVMRRGTESKSKVPNTVVDLQVKTRSRTKEEVIPVYYGKNDIGVRVGRPKGESSKSSSEKTVVKAKPKTAAHKANANSEWRKIASQYLKAGKTLKEASIAYKNETKKPKTAIKRAGPQRKVISERTTIEEEMAQIKAKTNKTDADMAKYIELQNKLTEKTKAAQPAKAAQPTVKKPTREEIEKMKPEQKLKYLTSLGELTPKQQIEFIKLTNMENTKPPTGRSMFK